jgi:hypothetical protein
VREQLGHVQLIDEVAIDEEALAPAAFYREAHSLIQFAGTLVVCHDGELEAVHSVCRGPQLQLPEQSGADSPAACGSVHAAVGEPDDSFAR